MVEIVAVWFDNVVRHLYNVVADISGKGFPGV
jgi:hypothetical protein